jgi:translation initiation factor 3 subunit K
MAFTSFTDRAYRKSGIRGWCVIPSSSPLIYSYATPDRYNPSNVGILEDYLYHQIRSEEYDCLANLAILKL